MTSIARPTVYGAAYSTYVRTVRMTLVEKGIPYELAEVDVFAPGGPPAEYLHVAAREHKRPDPITSRFRAQIS